MPTTYHVSATFCHSLSHTHTNIYVYGMACAARLPTSYTSHTHSRTHTFGVTCVCLLCIVKQFYIFFFNKWKFVLAKRRRPAFHGGKKREAKKTEQQSCNWMAYESEYQKLFSAYSFTDVPVDVGGECETHLSWFPFYCNCVCVCECVSYCPIPNAFDSMACSTVTDWEAVRTFSIAETSTK